MGEGGYRLEVRDADVRSQSEPGTKAAAGRRSELLISDQGSGLVGHSRQVSHVRHLEATLWYLCPHGLAMAKECVLHGTPVPCRSRLFVASDWGLYAPCGTVRLKEAKP